MADYDDDEFTSREGIIVGVIALLAIFTLVVTLIFSSADIDFDLFDLGSWGVKEWTSLGIWLLIGGAIILAIYWGSDDEGIDDVFEGGYGFPVTIGVLLIGLLLVNTSFFGLAVDESELIDLDGDGTGDLRLSELPDGYVDYGSPQPYGFGNWGPEDEGLLTDFEGAGAGCLAVGSAGAIIGTTGFPLFGTVAGALGGCAIGLFGGYAFSSADFDGDPTTGW